ncbi:hypothetical protein [Streptomyces sp. NPDC008121]|uniref:hypothetical protein n=1 Tax=Streptomyces sp. NPDC008121 TaxID=3364809 RepID=UPI0036E9D7E1
MSDDAVTPDLPAAGPSAPEIRIPGTGKSGEDGEDGSKEQDEKKRGGEEGSDGRPAAGPGTPAPQEPTG